MINMNVSIKGLNKAMLMLDPKKVASAARMSINESLSTGQSTARKEIRQDWNLKASRINKEVRGIKRAKTSDLTAILQAKGRPISLVHFGAKWRRGRVTMTGKKSTIAKRGHRKGQGGVTVSVRKGKQVRLPRAFMATTRNGYMGVFMRKGKARLPIRSMSSVTIATMFNQPGVLAPTVRAIDARLNKRFRYHLNRLMR